MTDDNRDGDVYRANYHKQSGYASYTKSYSPLTYLTVLKASDGKLIVGIDMILWHNPVASGYSTVLSAKWQGRAYADLN